MTTKSNVKLRPLANRVLVKRQETEEKTIGGIILPDSAQTKQDIGEVIATGPGKKDNDGNHVKIEIKVGDKVMWDKYGGQEVTIEEESYVILKDDDIIAIVE